MHDVVAFVELGKVDLRAVGLLAGAAQRQAARAGVAVASEELGVREHCELCSRESEPVGDRADRQLHAAMGDERLGQQIAEPLHLALVVAIDRDLPAAVQPLRELVQEPFALPGFDHQIPGLELAQTVIEKCRRIILHLGVGSRVCRDGSARPVDARLHIHHEIARRNVVAQRALARFPGFAQQDARALHRLHGGLHVEIEKPKRVDLVAKEFHAHGDGVLPRKEIDDAAAHSVLPAQRHLGHAFVTRCRHFGNQGFQRDGFASGEFQREPPHPFRRRGGVVERSGGKDDERVF